MKNGDKGVNAVYQGRVTLKQVVLYGQKLLLLCGFFTLPGTRGT